MIHNGNSHKNHCTTVVTVIIVIKNVKKFVYAALHLGHSVSNQHKMDFLKASPSPILFKLLSVDLFDEKREKMKKKFF